MKAKHTKQYHRQAHRNEAANSTALFVRRVMCALSVTVVLGASLLVVCSLVAYMTPDPDRLVLPLGLLSAAMTAFFGRSFSTGADGIKI